MKQEQWTKLWKFVAAVALALSALATTMAGLTLWAPAEGPVARDYQCDVYTEQGCAKFVIASGGELEVQSGGTLDLQSGSTITQNAALEMNNNVINNIGNAGTDFGGDGGLTTAGGITITTGGLEITSGGITATGVVTFSSVLNMFDNAITNIGNAGTDFDAYGGLTTASGISVTASGIIVSAGGISATGDSTVNGGFTVNGDITLENGEVISNSTDGDVFVNGSLLGFTNIISKAADYTLQVVESGSLFTNMGASGELSLTLPGAAAGLRYCFYIGPTQAVTLVVGGADMVHHLTNAAGDRLMNGTAGDSVCLTAIDDVLWVPTDETGTWNDVD